MDAKRKSVTSYMITVFIPGGMLFCCSASAAFTSVAICVALEPAICCTIPIQAGIPSLTRLTLYIREPSSILATSFSFNVWPVVLLVRMMFSYCIGSDKRPLYRRVYS